MLGIHTFDVLALSDPCIHVPSHAHGWVPVKFDLFSSKQMVNLLERKVARLRIEEVDERKEAEVKDCWATLACWNVEGYANAKEHTGKIYVSSIADVGDADGSDFDDQECKDPYDKMLALMMSQGDTYRKLHTVSCSRESC